MQHVLYRTGDVDAPAQIKDRNGHVVLECCRNCGKAEGELAEAECVGGVKVEKPHRGRIQNWHKIPAGDGGWFVWGEFLDHPHFGREITNTSQVLKYDVPTGEIETINSRYTLVGEENDVTKRQVRLWMEDAKTGANHPNQSEEDGKRAYETVLAEYTKLYAVLEIDRRAPGLSRADQVALIGVACNRAFGP